VEERATEVEKSQGVPARALLFSILALAVPVLALVFWPDQVSQDFGLLVWLMALIPPFLLTYHRGWLGASLALIVGMTVLVGANLLIVLTGRPTPEPSFMVWLTGTYVFVCVGAGALSEVLRKERRMAEELALVDALTGLANRRHANIFLDAAFSAAARGRPVCVIVFDLDRFKRLNDEFGHRTGDAILKDLGAILRRSTRRMDLSARWGGEEFISILTNCRVPGALVFADRVRQEIRSQDYPWGPVTLSAGIAAFEPGMGTPEVLVAAADRALYHAKEEGRDRCSVVSGEFDERGMAAGIPDRLILGLDDADAPEWHREKGRPDQALRRSIGSSDSPPAIRPWEGARIDDEASPTLLGIPGGSERLLLVDDDASARDVVGRLLRHLGYTVSAVADAESAIELARTEGPWDLLVTDLILPGMSGFALADVLLREVGPIRVLYVSGQVREGMVWWPGVPGDRVGFLEKPMSVEGLAVKIRELLDLDQEAAPANAP